MWLSLSVALGFLAVGHGLSILSIPPPTFKTESLRKVAVQIGIFFFQHFPFLSPQIASVSVIESHNNSHMWLIRRIVTYKSLLSGALFQN